MTSMFWPPLQQNSRKSCHLRRLLALLAFTLSYSSEVQSESTCVGVMADGKGDVDDCVMVDEDELSTIQTTVAYQQGAVSDEQFNLSNLEINGINSSNVEISAPMTANNGQFQVRSFNSSIEDIQLHTKQVDTTIASDLGTRQAASRVDGGGFAQSLHSTSSNPTSLWNSWSFEMKIANIELWLLMVILIIRELGVAREWWGKSNWTGEGRYTWKMAEVVRLLAAGADYMYIIPIALDLSYTLGGYQIMSGFIISCFSLGSMAGALVSLRWTGRLTQPRKRFLVVFSISFGAACQGLLAIAMTMPNLSNAVFLTILMTLCRLVSGFALGVGAIHQSMICQACTQQERNMFDVWLPVADFVGYILGAFTVATTMNIPNPNHSQFFSDCATPVACIAALCVIAAVLISQRCPSTETNLEQVTYTNDEKSEAPVFVSYEPDILATVASDVLDNSNRKAIAVRGFMQVAVGALIANGCETATSYLMEADYGWTATDTAWGMTVVLTVALAIVAIIICMRLHWGSSIDKIVGVMCCIFGGIATPLYFTHTFSGAGDKYHLFLGDIIVYPCMLTVAGMAAGYALWAANPEKWNHSDNVLVTSTLTDGLCKFFGAPFIRGMIWWQGRDAYAIMQVVLIGFSFLNFWWIRNVNMYIDKAILEEAVPKGTSFYEEIRRRKDKLLKPFRSKEDPVILEQDKGLTS